MASRPAHRNQLWRAELQRGARHLRAGEVDAARAAFQHAHRLAPEEAEPALALGRIEWRLGKTAEAGRLLRHAYEARPEWPLAAAALARFYLSSRRPAQRRAALGVLRRARQHAPDHPAIWVVLGEHALDRRRVADARRAFASAEQAGADRDVVRAGMSRVENAAGLSLAARKRLTEAAFTFKRSADLDPSWAPPRVNLGAVLERLGRSHAALAHYELALTLDPGHGLALFHVGRLRAAAGDHAGAERALVAAVAARPRPPRARHELALLLAERGKLHEAVVLLEEELAARPRARQVRRNLGRMLVRLAYASVAAGNLLEGAELYRRARALGNFAPPQASK
jgi:Flp pilus assembly protein TadD